MHRYERDDWQWSLVRPLLPPQRTRGRSFRGHRQVVQGILWVLFTAAPWRDTPDRYGPWQTAHKRLGRWRADGTRAGVMRCLRLRANRRGLLDCARWNVDSTSLRSGHPAAGAEKKGNPPGEPPDHALGLSRGGMGTKLHPATDARGLPIGFVVTGGNRNECPTFGPLVEATRVHTPRHRLPRHLAADKGYGSDKIRDWLPKRRVDAVIPMRANEHLADGSVSRSTPRRTAAATSSSGAWAGSSTATASPHASRNWRSTSRPWSCSR